MALATDLTAASWRTFSTLLERALELPADERLAWVESLGTEHEALKPALRSVLQRSAGIDAAEWLDTLPHTSLPAGMRDDVALRPQALVGPYRLLRELGVGGMGAVWLAERADGTLKRQVALKLPRASWFAGLAQRMARERDILASLEHPSIARLYDAGTDAHGRPFLALEYVEGQPIDVYCRERALNTKARLALLLQVARAVAFAHGRLVVHRDLKPSNILVTGDGQVRLLDFGIAKLMEGDRTQETQLTRLAGQALTLDYASPEQIRGEQIGTASDVYSLGVVAFELLAGARPYKLKRGSAAELEEAIATTDAPLASSVATDATVRKELRGDLDAILGTALRKDAAQRYASVDAFAQDIERHLDGEPVQARPASAGYRLRKFVGRNRLAVGAGAAVLVAIVAGASVAIWQASVAIEQARIAREQGEAARNEAKRAQAVQTFLLDIFRRSSHQQADPMKARATTARELLDVGAAQVGESLKDAPEAQLQVLAVLTDMYTQLSLKDEAQALQRRSLELARRTFAANDVRLADALLTHSQTLHGSSRRAEIPALVAEARAILDGAGEQNTFLRGALLYETARFQRDESLPAARASADELVAFFRAYQPKRATLINGLRLAARARLIAFEPAEAEALSAQSVELAKQREGAAAAWMAGPLADLHDAQWAQWKVGDAERSIRDSIAQSLKVNGEAHAETLQSNAKLAALLMRTGRIAEGEALAREVLARFDTPGARYSTGTLANVRTVLAAPYVELGVPRRAEAAIVADIDDLRATMPRSGTLALRQLTLAEIRVDQGGYDEAEQLLQESEVAWKTFVGDAAPARVFRLHALARAELALARRAASAALEQLAAIPPLAASTSSAPIDGLAVVADIRRSEAALQVGQRDEALQAAERAVAALRATPAARVPVIEGRALVALGRAQVAAGRSAEALATLSEAVSLHERSGHRESLWLADAQLALAHALAARDPGRSRSLVAAARSIQASAGEVGPHWRQVVVSNAAPVRSR